MKDEADKRESSKRRTRCDEKIEINMYPEWDASINYPPDAWVVYRGEKRLAVSIKKEWQPDWSQAPDNCSFFCVASAGGYGFFTEIHPELMDDYFYVGCGGLMIEEHGYKGPWQQSLRKRPEGL